MFTLFKARWTVVATFVLLSACQTWTLPRRHIFLRSHRQRPSWLLQGVRSEALARGLKEDSTVGCRVFWHRSLKKLTPSILTQLRREDEQRLGRTCNAGLKERPILLLDTYIEAWSQEGHPDWQGATRFDVAFCLAPARYPLREGM